MAPSSVALAVESLRAVKVNKNHFHRVIQPRRWLAMLVMIVMAGLMSACGYSHKELFPTDVGTVAVPIFVNRSFYEGMERDVTEALIKEIELRTPYKVVPQNIADTVLQGTITAVNQNRLSRHHDGGVAQEMEVSIVSHWEWKNVRTGKTIRDRKGFRAVGRYISTSPVGQSLSLGQSSAAQATATAIVSEMRAEW